MSKSSRKYLDDIIEEVCKQREGLFTTQNVCDDIIDLVQYTNRRSSINISSFQIRQKLIRAKYLRVIRDDKKRRNLYEYVGERDV